MSGWHEADRVHDLNVNLSKVTAKVERLEAELDRIIDLNARLTECLADFGGSAVMQERVEQLRAALVGANWIISKLAPHEVLAITARGYRVSREDQATGAKYRALIDAALANTEAAGNELDRIHTLNIKLQQALAEEGEE
ncbi:MAG: hypothetical protein Q7O66_19775 [Dehalococcoidia bacterium]|nr:hypothetical protein [Dehalococcoidia bacterium]